MNKFAASTGLFFLFFCSTVNLLSQEKVYMPFFEVINMNYEYQYSVSRLLKTYLEDDNRYALVLPPKPDSLYPSESFETTKARAESYGAKYFIISELNRVGEMVLISIALYNTSDGVKIWSDKLKAKTPEDLDPIMQRIAKNIGTGRKAALEGDIYSVTDFEGEELKKTSTNNYFGISVGGVSLFTSIPFTTLAGVGLIWSYDAKNILMELKAQGYWATQSSVYDVSVETYYPFSKNPRTLFIGGGLGISGVNDNDAYYFPSSNSYRDRHGYGLMFLPGGGYMFNRTSSATFRLSGNAVISAYKTNGEYPLGFMLKMELLFHR